MGCSDHPRLNCALRDILQRFLPVKVFLHLVERFLYCYSRYDQKIYRFFVQ